MNLGVAHYPLRGAGLSLDRETYIALAYPQGKPDLWTAEHEAELVAQKAVEIMRRYAHSDAEGIPSLGLPSSMTR